MTSKELNLKLIELLPEIKKMYEDEVSWQEGDETGSHVVFGDVFYPYISKCINSQSTECLVKCFSVIEKILLCSDEYANEVITFSVLENLLYLSELQIDLPKYMGNITNKIFKELADSLA